MRSRISAFDPRTLLDSIAREIADITPLEIARLAGVFIVMLLAAKFGQYLFFEWKTSPAILWPPTGIALAAMWLWGYRYAVPIFLALLVASLTGPVAHLIPAVVTTPMAQVFGSLTGVYFLRHLKFNGSFSRMRNVALFFAVAIITSAIAPSVTTLISSLTGNLTAAAYISWSRSWAGYLLSVIILTPLIISWSRADYGSMRGRWIEPICAGALVAFSVYALFWQPFPEEFSFLAFVVFFLAHFWVCLRFPTMVVMTSLSFTTLFGIFGLFVSPGEEPLNQQLFAAELFLFLVVPIFYAFSALVKERAYAVIELQQAMQKIERESTIKNDFIAVLAHELRNPLAPVKTTLEILGMLELDQETRELIRGSHRQVHAMRRLLDDLLDVTRVTQGKFQIKPTRVNLCVLIENSIKSTVALFDRGHHFVVDPPCDRSIWLEVDSVRFEQALVNLLNNAAKYTEPGGRITISCAQEGGMLKLMVTDNGIGIDPEHLESVFEPFWQASMSPSNAAGGVGIGLSLTRHIMELHGGSVRAQSAGAGQGSTFTITVPLPERDVPPEPAVAQAPSPRAPFKVLVVDDNHAAADALVKLLTLKGHNATASYSGTDAIELIKTYAPQIVLLDIGLPDMTGFEVAAQMRADGFAGKIIALSGYGQQEDRERSRQAGCDEHFTKPMSISRLEDYFTEIS